MGISIKYFKPHARTHHIVIIIKFSLIFFNVIIDFMLFHIVICYPNRLNSLLTLRKCVFGCHEHDLTDFKVYVLKSIS